MEKYIKKSCVSYLLHLSTIIIIIAPKRADITETIINVKVHPNSPAVSEIKQIRKNIWISHFSYININN